MIRTETSDGIGWIVLDRPEVKNALSAELIRKAREALDLYRDDDAVRAIVFTGAGDVFSAGADLREMKEMGAASEDENVAHALPLFDFFLAVLDSPKPTIARLNGPAIAGALGLACACDVVVAIDGIRFAFTEVRLGIVPAMISPFVVRRIGPVSARRLFLTGERVDAQEALTIGLVDRVVPAGELDAAVEAVCAAFRAAGPKASAEVKALVDRVASGNPADHGEHTARLLARLRASDEAQEGLRAFLEKRKPRWPGT